jgi:hypothetical protein
MTVTPGVLSSLASLLLIAQPAQQDVELATDQLFGELSPNARSSRWSPRRLRYFNSAYSSDSTRNCKMMKYSSKMRSYVMKNKFVGTFEELQSLITRMGISGEWSCPALNQYQFRANTGAVLNWYKSTGTVSFQGPEVEAAIFADAYSKAALAEAPEAI